MLEHFQKRPRSIGAVEIDRLTLLYKKASAHLAYIRTYHPNDEVTRYLNQLVARAHNIAYQQQSSSLGQLSRFFWVHLFSLVHKRIWFIGLAGLLFAIGGISGFAAVMVDPLNLYYVLPEGMAAQIDPSRLGEGHDAINSPLMSTAIMLNNIKVAFLAFISGITLGVFPVYLLLFNGLLVGALASVYSQADSSYAFWAYILPHGVIELTAIFIPEEPDSTWAIGSLYRAFTIANFSFCRQRRNPHSCCWARCRCLSSPGSSKGTLLRLRSLWRRSTVWPC